MAKVTDIIRELESIRRKLGGKPVDFTFERIRIDDDLTSLSEVEALFHPSGFLMRRGGPVFVYIRDHTVSGYQSPEQARKIHFYKCKTLLEMKRKERFELRYRVTNRDDNRYLIDSGGWWGKSKEKEVILYPCQNCLERVFYQCFSWQMDSAEKQRIIRDFDAKVAFSLIEQQFDIFRQQIEESKLRSSSLPTGYPRNFRVIAGMYKKSRDYICEQCGVDLRHAKQCLDMHHRDHDKQNSRDSNLACLCKNCHARQHPHYRVSAECQRLIQEALRSS